ncbi:MAG: pilus assembly protein [Deltaproteobacteria bacterium]|nr:pilus assembly protein [Deltaproteobacteria bacterium]
MITQKIMKLSKPFHTAVRRFRQRTEGVSAVEIALCLPLILLCLCGIVDFGNLYVNSNLVSEAASTGALVAANAATTQTALQPTVRLDYGSNGNPNTNLTVTTSYGDTPPLAVTGTGTPITVTVTTPVSVITPMIRAYFQSNPVTVTGTSTRVTEY